MDVKQGSNVDVDLHESELGVLCEAYQKTGDEKYATAVLNRTEKWLYSYIYSKYTTRIPADCLEDYMQEGRMGILRAMQAFDVTKGYSFLTYATYYLHSIDDAVKADQFHTAGSRHKHSEWCKVLQCSRDWDILQSPETDKIGYIASEMGITEGRALQLLKEAQQKCYVGSIDGRLVAESDTTFADMIADDRAERELYHYEDVVDRHRHMSELMHRVLSDREYWIIAHYYGFEGGKAMTLRELSSALGISRERVRQLISRGMRILRSSKTISAQLRELV